MKIVLDTNIVLYFLAGRLVEVLPPAEFFYFCYSRNGIAFLSITDIC